jgi:cytochrome c553
MRTCFFILMLAMFSALVIEARPPQTAPDKALSWAFPMAPDRNEPPLPETPGPKSLPGSSKTYTQAQIDDLSNPPDWYPDEHGPLPAIINSGASNKGFACGSCHLMSGHGHPESSDLTGISADYIVQQMADFKSGARKEPIRMNIIAQATSDEDVRAAAQWFAALKPSPWVKVVETDTVPVTYLGPGRMRFVVANGGMEPIGNRIIEVPDDVAKARSRDPHTGFIAYVPSGSIAKGKELVETGASGKTRPCEECHGDGLTGLGDVPRLAGVHPIYLVRQLYNYRSGANNGASAYMMQGVAAKLTDQDILDLAAYAAAQSQ